MSTQHPSNKSRKKGPKLTKDGKITVFDVEDTSYGIRELIDLIRYIPDGQDVFFGAEMIKKTLSSMQLSVHDIMQDGVEKRKLAAKTIQHLVAEISDYQRRIQSLKGHIRHLRFELGEIQDTCHYLLSDDIELSQYQHILDEVPKSPIEGGDGDDDMELEVEPELAEESKAPVPPIIEPTHQGEDELTEEPEPSEESVSIAEETPAPSMELSEPSDDFEESKTLVEPNTPPQNDFVPDAFKNPDENYQEAPEASVLTDEVFDPDRFDDENGVQNGKPPVHPELTADDEPMDNDQSAHNGIDAEISTDPLDTAKTELKLEEEDDDDLTSRL